MTILVAVLCQQACSKKTENRSDAFPTVAEKELSFAMELAWDIDAWKPENAHRYIGQWASRIFGKEAGAEIAGIYGSYYRLMASGKDSHVYFLDPSIVLQEIRIHT